MRNDFPVLPTPLMNMQSGSDIRQLHAALDEGGGPLHVQRSSMTLVR